MHTYFIALVLLFVLSAFFSGSETALMRVNRYRLAHLAANGHRNAKRTIKLLENPDQLIAVILFGNNLVNILIAQLVAYIGYRLHGEIGIVIATAILTFMLLMFAELAPKTFATVHAQKVALPAGFVYSLLRIPLYPFTWLADLIIKSLFKMLGISDKAPTLDSLNREELRTVLAVSEKRIPYNYRGMLVGVLDLERKTVEDIMVPRNEISGIDLNLSFSEIEDDLHHTTYTRMPVFRGTIDSIVGILHARQILQAGYDDTFDVRAIEEHVREPYFVSEHTRLIDALRDFKQHKRNTALVVDEYGTVQGLVTMEDLLEEIVGEFTKDPSTYDIGVTYQADGSVLVDGSCHIRELNQALGWKLNESGPKTVNGVLLETLEMIPDNPTCAVAEGYRFEIIKTHHNAIKMVRIIPDINKPAEAE